jgi:hypothetical protein
MPEDRAAGETVARTQLRAGLVLALFLASAALAYGTYVVFLREVVTQRFVPHDVDRLLRKAALLEGLAASGRRNVLFYGSSVVMEGVDATVVEEHLPDEFSVYNAGEGDAGVVRLMFNLRYVARARPELLVCCFRRTQLLAGTDHSVPPELLTAYAYAGYLDAAQREPTWVFDWLTQEEIDVLPHGAVNTQLACRTFFLRHWEEQIRARSRHDLRVEGVAGDFRSPWHYREQLSSDRLEREVSTTRRIFQEVHYDGENRQMRVLAVCLERLFKQGIPTLIVLTPEHPRVADALEPETRGALRDGLASLCAQWNAALVDLPLDLLAAEDYIDAAHANAQGRARLSDELGRRIARFLEHKTGR